jgi:DNA (cytosine-5)-methyltransferase 1
MGYHRAGFEVVGVDIKPQPRYPFEFHQADAMTCPLKGFKAIHASPPCQRYSQATPPQFRANHPDLIAAVRERLLGFGAPFAIENVSGARWLLRNPVMLCGTMFGLPIERHRYFEIHPNELAMLPPCAHGKLPVVVTGTTRRKTGRFEYPAAACRAAMQTDWMTRAEMDEAIPPAYTEWIGQRLLEVIGQSRAA